MRCSLLTTLIVVLMMAAPEWNQATPADNGWPQWRGPNRNAISLQRGLLKAWTEKGPELSWQAFGLGKGYSSIVLGEGRIFTIGRQNNDVFVIALNQQTGERLWRTKIGHTDRIPSSTPTLDGKQLYALGPDGELVCIQTLTGRILWSRHFIRDFDGIMQSGRGFGESPLIDGERLICTPGGKETTIVALEKSTGKVHWKSAVPEIGMMGRDGAGFSSIVVSEGAGVRQYVQLLGRGLIGVASDDGRFLWGYNDIANRTANIPTPITQNDFVFAANGYGAGSVLLKLEKTDDREVVARPVYSLRGGQFQNHHGGIILFDGHIYGGHGSNNGLPTCVNMMSGKVLWKRRGPGIGSASIVYADERLYMRYQNGLMALVEISPAGYTLRGTFQIPGAGSDSWSHPVVADGRLYLREKNRILAYDIRQTSDPVQPSIGKPGTDTVQAMRLRDLGAQVDRTARPPQESYVRMRQFERYRFEKNDRQGYSVTLNDNHITSDGTISEKVIATLRTCRGLKELHLTGTSIGQSGLNQLSDLPELEVLNLELCTSLSKQFVIPTDLLAGLRVLILSGTLIDDTGLSQIKRGERLVGLDLEVCENVTNEGLVHLAHLTSLRWLVLKRTGFGPNPLSDLGLKSLAPLAELEILNLYGNKITDAGLLSLSTLNRLQQLDLSLTAVTSQGMSELSRFSHLERLDLTYSEGFLGPQIGDSGLQHLAKISSLKSLSLIGAKVHDEALNQLTTLKHLEELNLVGTETTAAGVGRLRRIIPHCTIVH